ncbi:hypothetical protein BDQ94DRAFT_152204 [Aspergillus welwitschiae]|uniref:Uncharacterized protein n=1 Tax=Aspergillus welwitschiae TaxID=1341132 RepID=A0A3F3PNM5_9EURO|nr:hypothetical protein BDQ94DRAFT_152204 [Aspergillus welwitschiae]RDH28352.1 hypothetical protein BDQ94DRAFT_152204 [Aspergillus welwitschiae]
MKNAAVAIGFSVGVMTALQTRDPSQSRVHGGFGSMKDSSIYILVTVPPFIPSHDPLSPYTAFWMGYCQHMIPGAMQMKNVNSVACWLGEETAEVAVLTAA